ncbi:MAG TPA: hypothetical protein DGD08_08565 [Gemmatimonas aurantiaca]|uniref:Terminase n=1 Tax=Gemmatimonas aurantiaca TaxID=173480 RepID=A0A3D4V825_9BACT|nr:hypothetical protein [Gemmatimonas aurantiaca]HCT57251.1 hypothetical protein [Gemmatimonas aurantiaca]
MTTLLGDSPSFSELFKAAVVETATVAPSLVIDHSAYRHDPLGWAEVALGVSRETLLWSLFDAYGTHEWDGTPDPLATVLEAIAKNQWVAVASGTGTGKTFLEAVLLLWWIAVEPDSIATTVATKADQQEKGIWREVARHWPRFQACFPEAELTTLRIRMEPWRGDAWGAWGITAAPKAGEESSSAVQGLHAKRLLILVDETPGVPQPVMTALVNTATGEENVIAAFGNPDYQADPLGQFAETKRVTAIRISALDHPNVVLGVERIPGAATRLSIATREDKYGVESGVYQSRVRGIAPEQSASALIHLAWCVAAADRAESVQHAALALGPKALGVDVAQSENGDKAAVAMGQGARLLSVIAKACPNATKLGAEVWQLMRDEGIVPEYVGVDPIGVGAATVNHLDGECEKENAGRSVVRCSGGAKAMEASSRAADGSAMEWLADANKFKNLRAQMWWQLREDLRNGLIALPRDRELFRELTTVQFDEDGGIVTLESKDDIRKRLGRSPDRADAVVYWNWVRPRTRVNQPPPEGFDVARPIRNYAPRQQTPAPFTTPQVTGWRPGAMSHG